MTALYRLWLALRIAWRRRVYEQRVDVDYGGDFVDAARWPEMKAYSMKTYRLERRLRSLSTPVAGRD